MPKRQSLEFVLLLPFLMAAIVGCPNNSAKTVASRGVLKTSKGEACEGALIVFHPLEKGRVNDPKPVATVDASGSFVLRTHTQDDGAEPGEYGVTVVWMGPASSSKEFSLSSETSSGVTDRLAGKYGNPKDPKFKVTIPSGGDQAIELKVDY